MGLMQLAMILEIILYRQFHREMGLKSLNEDGESYLGIKAMKVKFIGG